jgi:hypothetical protein
LPAFIRATAKLGHSQQCQIDAGRYTYPAKGMAGITDRQSPTGALPLVTILAN